MGTRIIFNGQEYTSVEAMPAGVRQAYQQALAQLADADRNGIPDILERGAAGNVIGIQHSSITVNGRTFSSVGEMPAPVRRLYEQAMGQVDANRNGVPDALEAAGSELETPSHGAGTVRPEFPWAVDTSTPSHPHGRERTLTVLDQTERALEAFLRILLSLVVVAILVGAVLMMLTMDAASRSQGGRFYAAVVAVVLLGLVDTQFARLAKRRNPLSWIETAEYRRYQVRSLLLLLLSTLVLVGLALLLP
jgi:hypothetical protein